MKFKKNDKIRVYASLNSTKAESKGIVIGIRKDGLLHVKLQFTTYREIVAHPKQCRKLVSRKKSK